MCPVEAWGFEDVSAESTGGEGRRVSEGVDVVVGVLRGEREAIADVVIAIDHLLGGEDCVGADLTGEVAVGAAGGGDVHGRARLHGLSAGKIPFAEDVIFQAAAGHPFAAFAEGEFVGQEGDEAVADVVAGAGLLQLAIVEGDAGAAAIVIPVIEGFAVLIEGG